MYMCTCNDSSPTKRSGNWANTRRQDSFLEKTMGGPLCTIYVCMGSIQQLHATQEKMKSEVVAENDAWLRLQSTLPNIQPHCYQLHTCPLHPRAVLLSFYTCMPENSMQMIEYCIQKHSIPIHISNKHNNYWSFVKWLLGTWKKNPSQLPFNEVLVPQIISNKA